MTEPVAAMRVRLEDAAHAEVRRLAAAAYPQEGCGVLVGRWDEEGISVTRATSGRNRVTDRAHDRYDLDPDDILAADREARGGGLDVVGFWHSHPDHSARPSQFDTDHAHPDYVYLICATTAAGAGDIGAYTLTADGGPFVTVPLAVDRSRV